MADLSIGRSRIVRFILVGSRSLVLARLRTCRNAKKTKEERGNSIKFQIVPYYSPRGQFQGYSSKKHEKNTRLAGALPDFGLDNLLNEGNSCCSWRICAVS
jgi:hypothetical protein